METIERIERARDAEQHHLALVVRFIFRSNTENISFNNNSARKTYAAKPCALNTYAQNNKSPKNSEPSKSSSI